MGACQFEQIGRGTTTREAFSAAHEQAAWEHGHGGYTGTLAEKGDFIEVRKPEGWTAEQVANDFHGARDWDNEGRWKSEVVQRWGERTLAEYDDKWGPALAVKTENENEWLFFGWASS